jgi:hypothetical protein
VLVWPAAPTAAGSSAVIRACATSDLVVWLDTAGSGAAGSVYYHLRFTNLSGRACTLHGYPGVSAIRIGGRQLGRAAGRNAARPSRRIVVASGATANSVLRIVNAGNYPASRCRPTTAAGLRVYPPNQRASQVVPFPFRACSGTRPAVLTVEAVASGP